MQHQLELGYLVLEVPDPESLSPVLGEVIGLTQATTSSDAIAWRNDERAHRLLITEGPANDAVTIGFEAVTEEGFDTIIANLKSIGCQVEQGTTQEAARRCVSKLVRTTAPWGTDVEVVFGLASAASPFESAEVPGGFLTEGVGFGHVVFAAQDADTATRFLVEGLGFAQSDWIETELAPGLELEVRFFHCNERHHTIALAIVPFEVPQLLHHIMFETKERDDVGAAFDRAWATDLAIPNGLGKHDNDGMFSFYLQTSAGFQIEVGYGARVIHDDWDENRQYSSISSWGHQPLRQS